MSGAEHVREEGEISEDDDTATPEEPKVEGWREKDEKTSLLGSFPYSSSGLAAEHLGRRVRHREHRGRRHDFEESHTSYRAAPSKHKRRVHTDSRRRPRLGENAGRDAMVTKTPVRCDDATAESLLQCNDSEELQSRLQNIRRSLASLQREEEAVTRKLQLGSLADVDVLSCGESDYIDKGNFPVATEDHPKAFESSSGVVMDEDIEELELRRKALLSATRVSDSASSLVETVEPATQPTGSLGQASDELAGLRPVVVNSGKNKKATKTATPAAVKPGVPVGKSAHQSKRKHVERELTTTADHKGAMRRANLREISLEKPLNPIPCRIPDERSLDQREARGVDLTLDVPGPKCSPTTAAITTAALTHQNGKSGCDVHEAGDNYETVAMDISNQNEPQIVVNTSTADNYESVSMDIDSAPQSPSVLVASLSGCTAAVSPAAAQHGSDDEEEVLMRQKLLKSLERRKATAINKKSSSTPASLETSQQKRVVEGAGKYQHGKSNVPLMTKTSVSKIVPVGAPSVRPRQWLVKAPLQKPIVIKLDDTSSSSDGEGEMYSPVLSVVEGSTESNERSAVSAEKSLLLSGVEMFLKQERQNAEVKQGKAGSKVVTDSVPSDKQAEYSKLKAELKKRELALISKRELENEKRIEEKELAALKLKDLHARLNEKRFQVDASHTTLAGLAEQISTKSQSVKVARSRVDKLRENLAAAERVANVAKQHLMRLLTDRAKVQNLIKKHSEDLLKIELECKQTGRIVLGDSYQPPSAAVAGEKRAVAKTANHDAIDKAPTAKRMRSGSSTPESSQNSQSPLALCTPTDSPSKGRGPYATERQRLLDLEKACSARLQELRGKQDSSPKPTLSVPSSLHKRISFARRLSGKLAESPLPDQTSKQQPPSVDKDSDVISLAAESSADEHEAVFVPRRRSTLLGQQAANVRPQLDAAVRAAQADSRVEKTPTIGSHRERSLSLSGNSKRSGRRSSGQQAIAGGRHSDTKLQRILAAHCEKLPPIYLADTSVPSPMLTTVHVDPDCGDTPMLSIRGLDDDLRPLDVGPCHFTLADTGFVYDSCLLHFKSYRLSPYYRTKFSRSLLSSSYANLLDAKKIVCSYDLLGKCNDGGCKWQHLSASGMSPAQVMQDLVLYCPSLAGATIEMSDAERTKLIDAHVTRFIKKHENKMTAEEMCLLLVTTIRQELRLVLPLSVLAKPRAAFRVANSGASKINTQGTSASTNLVNSATGCETNLNAEKGVLALPFARRTNVNDDVIGESDTRYFMLDTDLVPDMEQGLTEDPTNINVWIKLSYKKLYDLGGIGCEEAVDSALNVLSRGLEHNHCNEKLWLTYLNLFGSSKRSENDRQDYLSLCRQALCLAPSYETHWQYIVALDSVGKKSAAADDAIAFLTASTVSDKKDEDASLTSHRILEVFLYIVALLVQSGCLKEATHRLKSFLHHPGNSGLRRRVTAGDIGFVWCIFIYVVAFRRLPTAALFLEEDDNPGRLLFKQPLTFPWHALNSDFLSGAQYDQLCKHLRRAIADCKGAAEYEVCFKRNYVSLMVCANRKVQAEEVLQQWLVNSPTSDASLWQDLAKTSHNAVGAEAPFKVIEEAIAANPTSMLLYGAAASWALESTGELYSLEGKSIAASYLERAVRALIQTADCISSDATTLYRKLLGECVPLEIHNVVIPAHIIGPDQSLDLWLNYCLLLELQDVEQAKEAYETATYRLTNSKHLQTIWSRYLAFLCKLSNKRGVKEFWAAFRRCLMSLSTETQLPFSSAVEKQRWTDYTFHNALVDYVCVHLKEDAGVFLERCLRLMPRNAGLLKRCCVHAVRRNDLGRAQWFCQQATQSRIPVASVDLWRMHARLLLKAGLSKEASQLLQRATRLLPYSVAIWKDYILCLVTSDSTQQCEVAIKEAKSVGVNIQDFVDAVVPRTGS